MMILQCSKCSLMFRNISGPYDVKALNWEPRGEVLLCPGCVADERRAAQRKRKREDAMNRLGWIDAEKDPKPTDARNILIAYTLDGHLRVSEGYYSSRSASWWVVTGHLDDKVRVDPCCWREMLARPDEEEPS